MAVHISAVKARQLRKRRASFQGTAAENNARHDKITGGRRIIRLKPLVPAWRLGPLGVASAFLMPSGKYVGKPIAEVPFDYLWGMGDGLSLDASMRQIVETEVFRRIDLGTYPHGPVTVITALGTHPEQRPDNSIS